MNISRSRLTKTTGKIKNLTVAIVLNDITKEVVDAITNAANEDLWHGGGVAGAISRKGGPIIQKESREYVKKYGRVKTGTCGYTSGGNLHCKYVIHAVGPIWNDSVAPEVNINYLHSAVLSTLQMASKLDCQSVAIPAISSGIFGFPKPLCA
jgi:putative ATPase